LVGSHRAMVGPRRGCLGRFQRLSLRPLLWRQSLLVGRMGYVARAFPTIRRGTPNAGQFLEISQRTLHPRAQVDPIRAGIAQPRQCAAEHVCYASPSRGDSCDILCGVPQTVRARRDDLVDGARGVSRFQPKAIREHALGVPDRFRPSSCRGRVFLPMPESDRLPSPCNSFYRGIHLRRRGFWSGRSGLGNCSSSRSENGPRRCCQ